VAWSGRWGRGFGRARGLPVVVVVVNLPQVGEFARATGTLANTDRIDASMLARLAY